MDEEKQNDVIKKAGDVIKKGAKDQANKAMKKFFKKAIMVVAPLILKSVIIAIIIAVILTSIKNFLNGHTSETSKEADAFAVKYSASGNEASEDGEETSSNNIIVDVNKRTADGAYILTYEFKDDEGNVYTEEEALNNIKNDLIKENKELDLSLFSDSELKVIGSLMYNGLKVEKYNEEELKALVIFVKADIASQSFDFRTNGNIGEKITLADVNNNDQVYGTLQVHRTNVETDANGEIIGYKEKVLDFVPYGDELTAGTFCYMVAQKDIGVIGKFSIDGDGNLVIAKWATTTTEYEYLDEQDNKLSDEDKQKISKENLKENVSQTYISVSTIEYKQYIKRYTMSYGFLSDLLITTQNPDLCLELAELAFNSKIVINVKEELITTEEKYETDYEQRTLFYDYVKYKVTGEKENTTETWQEITSANGEPINDSSLASTYEWSSSLPYTETGEGGGTYIYDWNHSDGTRYQLKYINISSYKHWTLYKRVTNTQIDLEESQAEEGELIRVFYDGLVEEDYTEYEDFKYTIIEATKTQTNKYDFEISEVDTWYLKYYKEYKSPTKKQEDKDNTKEDKDNTIERKGEYSEQETILDTDDESQIKSDTHVINFISSKENEYPEAEDVECKVTHLTVKQRVKTYSSQIYKSTSIKYEFGEEKADTTQVHFKNVEYIGEIPSFTAKDANGNIEEGFLYYYDKYRQDGVDLFLKDDLEKTFFDLLESDTTTLATSDIIKYLLYVYDGVDRGVTDLEKAFTIIDINLTTGGGISPFGCPITREEFIEAAEAYR